MESWTLHWDQEAGHPEKFPIDPGTGNNSVGSATALADTAFCGLQASQIAYLVS